MKTYKEVKEQNIFKLRPNAYAYGYAFGLIQLEENYIAIPGDLNNAQSYDYQVLLAALNGANANDLKSPTNDTKKKVVELAKAIEEQGVKGLSYTNGVFASCHSDIVSALNIPVVNIFEFVNLVHDYFLGGVKKVGILTLDSRNINESFLKSLGFIKNRNIAVYGLEEIPVISEQISGQIESLDAAEFDSAVKDFIENLMTTNPDIKALVIESNLLTPYSKTVRSTAKIPVYDLRNALDYVYLSTHQKEYNGDY